MRKRRLLAFLLCLAMLLSNVTDTFATVLSEDTGALQYSSSEEPKTEDVLQQKSYTDEPVSLTYITGESEGEPVGYQTIADAMADMDSEKSGVYKLVIYEDMEVSGDVLNFISETARLEIWLNGCCLTVTDDARVRADIYNGNETTGAFKITDGKCLTLLPVLLDDEKDTDISDIGIVYAAGASSGTLVLGETYDTEGGLCEKTVRLHHIVADNGFDVVFEGNVCGSILPQQAVKELVFGNLTIDNRSDETKGIRQNVNLCMPVTVERFEITDATGFATVENFTVNGEAVVPAGSRMEMRGEACFHDLTITAEENGKNDSFFVTLTTLLDGDKENAQISDAHLRFDGTLNVTGTAAAPICLSKKNVVLHTMTDENGNLCQEEESQDEVLFAVGDSIADVGENAVVDPSFFVLSNSENDGCYVECSDNKLVVVKGTEDDPEEEGTIKDSETEAETDDTSADEEIDSSLVFNSDDTMGLQTVTSGLQDDESDPVRTGQIKIYARGVDGNETELACYTKWEDAAAYLTTLSNVSMTYIIEIAEDLDIGTALTFPAKAAEIEFRGAAGDEKVTLTYVGDLKLSSNTSFRNLNLVVTKYNSKIGVYEPYQSVVNLGGKNLYLIHTDATFASITGTSASNLYIYGEKSEDDAEGLSSQITVEKAVKTMNSIEISGADVKVGSGLKTTDAAISAIRNLSIDHADLTVEHGSIAITGDTVLASAKLVVHGNINVGNMEVHDEQSGQNMPSTLTGLAAVTRNGNNITKVTPQITINGSINYAGNPLTIALEEARTAGGVTSYEPIDFSADEMKRLLAAGIPLAKAIKVPSSWICASKEENWCGAEEEFSDYTIGKSGGYLTFQSWGITGVCVSYQESCGSETISVETYGKSFADAVAEINNLKNKRNYTIAINEVVSDQSWEDPKALAMPAKTSVDTLTIKAWTDESSQDVPVDLHYTGNLTLATNTVLEGVSFVQVVKQSSGIVRVDEQKAGYPDPVKVSTGGNALTVNGLVTFNTPVLLNGGNKGTLSFGEDGQLCTYTNGFGENSNIFCGTITGFAEVTIPEAMEFTISEYGTLSGKYTVANLNVSTLNVQENAIVQLCGERAGGNLTAVNLNLVNSEVWVTAGIDGKGNPVAGDVKVTNTHMQSGILLSEGKATLTNVTLEDAAEGYGQPEIYAAKDFTISGTLTCNADQAVLYIRYKNPTTSYLNISGKVLADTSKNRIAICGWNIDINGDVVKEYLTEKENGTQIFTAKNASTELFALCTDGEASGCSAAYSAANPDGYILMKSGTGVNVYYGDQVVVALCKGDASDGDLEGAEVLGYYTGWKEAVTAIESINNKNAEYTLLLLKNIGNEQAPMTLTMPKKAANVVVASKLDREDMERKKLCFTGNLSLGTNMVFVNTEFCPMAKKGKEYVGTAFSFSTGAYNLTLTEVETGSRSGMAMKDIAGNAKQTTTLDSSNLVVTGNVMNSGKVIVEKNTSIGGNVKAVEVSIADTLTVNGTFYTDTLELMGAATLDAEKNTVNIKDIHNNGTEANKIIYGTNTKGVPYLTMKGTVTGENATPVILNLLSAGKEKADYALQLDTKGVKVVLSDSQKLAVIEKAALSEFELWLNGDSLESDGTAEPTYFAVKANKNVYVVKEDTAAAENMVTLMDGTDSSWEGRTNCLDFSQAVNEINTRNASAKEYIIQISHNITDTNVTDSKAVGTLTLPKANMAEKVYIQGEAEKQFMLTYTGNISCSGELHMLRIALNPVNNKNVSTDTSITLSKDKRGFADLYLEQVTTVSDRQCADGGSVKNGFIAKIGGTKNVTNLYLENCDLRIKNGIGNVKCLNLDDAHLITGGDVTISQLKMTGQDTSWDALGKTVVGTIEISDNIGAHYIASRQTAGTLVPQFTVSGKVVAKEAVPWKVMIPESTITKIQYCPNYENVALVIAPKTSADKFVAYPFASQDVTDLISYKDSNKVVRIGDRLKMAVRIKNGAEETYAESFDEAVAIIDNFADPTASYEIELLAQGTVYQPAVIKTTKNGTTYGTLTLPKKAASVTISGQMDAGNPVTLLAYTGTLKPNCNVTFQNILLTEGTVKTVKVNGKSIQEFTPSYAITPAVEGAYTLTFAKSAETLQNEKNPSEKTQANLTMSAVNGKKGTVRVEAGNTPDEAKTVLVKGAVSVYALELAGCVSVEGVKDISLTALDLSSVAVLEGHGKLTVKKLVLTNAADTDDTAVLQAEKAISITDIAGENLDENDSLRIDTCFTTIANTSQKAASQLTIQGTIGADVNVDVAIRMYDPISKSYHRMTAEEADTLNVQTLAPAKNQKVVTLPKASAGTIAILYEADGDDEWEKLVSVGSDGNSTDINTYKYEGGLYITTLSPVISLTGEPADAKADESEAYYSADFLSWEQTVKEIDRIADTSMAYEISLLQNVGDLTEGETPLTALSMPAKAKRVMVTSDNGNSIFFTGSSISLKCDTVLQNVGLMAVKKQTKNGVTEYHSISYNINTGNFALGMYQLLQTVTDEDVAYESLPGTISGSAKGALEIWQGDVGTADNCLDTPASKISGIGTVTFWNNDWADYMPSDAEIMQTHYSISKGISGVGMLVLNPGVELSVDAGDVSVKNASLYGSSLYGKNVTVTATTTMESGTILSGTEMIGDGKVKLKDVMIADANNYICALQDKNGKTQLEITGTVNATADMRNQLSEDGTVHDSITVEIRYNDDSSPAQLYHGMPLIKAAKADASWFVPLYTTTGEEKTDGGEVVEVIYPGMGYQTEGYGVYRAGKEICYGRI